MKNIKLLLTTFVYLFTHVLLQYDSGDIVVNIQTGSLASLSSYLLWDNVFEILKCIYPPPPPKKKYKLVVTE